MSDITTPTIDKKKRLSVIWIIPLIALAIGVWMVIDTKMSEGPTITISFENADGLVANKTTVEYLNVAVGHVQQVILNDGMDGVVVKVLMKPEAKKLLRKDTEFWVVRARVGAGSVSGLSTLLAGAYIELSPGTGAEYKKKEAYVGLETPPLTPAGAPGVKLNLFSKEAGSVSTGDAVVYNGYKVGRIEGTSFDQDRNLVKYDVFIDAPFDGLVNSSVRFWNVSGISFKASATGVDLRTAALDTILFGGVAFGLPEGVSAGDPVESGTDFNLYNEYDQINENPYIYSHEYVVQFKQSLRGLYPGAPVEYRGIPVGHVKRIMFTEMVKQGDAGNGSAIPVLIQIEPGLLHLPDTQDSLGILKASIEEGVEYGLRASLATGNIVTGSLYVSMDYHDGVETQELGTFTSYATIPTINVGLDRIQEQVSNFLTKLNDLPLEETVESVDSMVGAVTVTLNSVNELLNDTSTKDFRNELNDSLVSFRKILEGLSPDGAAFQSFEGSLHKLNETLYNLDELTGALKDQPNSLIFSPKFPNDPIPGAK